MAAGRRALPEPYVANLGPHAPVLDHRAVGLAEAPWSAPTEPHAEVAANPFPLERRHASTATARPHPGGPVRGVDAPIDADLHSWLTGRFGEGSARAIAGLTGPLTFDHDPGRLSAAFVVERIQRILLTPVPTARYVGGGLGGPR